MEAAHDGDGDRDATSPSEPGSTAIDVEVGDAPMREPDPAPAEPPPDASLSGAPVLEFGKYRLLRLLGRGGMGEVYLARLLGEFGFEKRLVIKTILPELAKRPRFVELFAAEAKTAVALSHGNIVPIYELGRTGDMFYIAMGWVDGPSLSQLLSAWRERSRAPELGLALHVVRGVLTGLAYAHTPEPGRTAVVHRDVTPRNVLVDRSGQVRIVDFGIAAPVDAQVRERGGSTGYAAPEQFRGESVDPRADVFSAACLLYELVTLDRAFPKDGVWSPPDLSSVPKELASVIDDALAIDPARRPRDAHALLDRLSPIFAHHAATYTDARLAAHLREMFPAGWDVAAESPSKGAITPSTRERKSTQTFATRLTAVTDEPARVVSPTPAPPATAARSGPGPWLLGVVLAAGVAGLWIAASDDDEKASPRVAPTKPTPVRPEPPAKADPPIAKVDPPIPIEPTSKKEEPTVVDPPTKAVPAPAIPKSGKPGWLKVVAPKYTWTQVFINGKKNAKWQTPTTIQLAPGSYRLVVRCMPDVCDETKTLHSEETVVTSGVTKEIRVD